MKRYTKDGHLKTKKEIVLKKDGKQIINPSEEMILSDGWEEYIPVVSEPTDAEILNREKKRKINEILRFDSSNKVNRFYVGESEIWLDKATRAGLLLRFQAEKAQGKFYTTLWYEGQQFPLPVDQAIEMLYAIELYASACYDNTQKHISAINAMDNTADVNAYDYTLGYPDKLKF